MGIKEDYIKGWNECSRYMGRPPYETESAAYFEGFDDCTASYHKEGWLRKKDGKMIGTPPFPKFIPGKLWRKNKRNYGETIYGEAVNPG